MFKSKLKFARGTRFVSFLFIGASALIAAGILFAANMYYNIDTGEVVTQEIQRITGILRATAGVIVKGTADQSPASGVGFQVAADDVLLSAANQILRFSGGTNFYVGFRATTTIATTTVYTWPATYPAATDYVLTSSQTGAMSWLSPGALGLGDITAVGDCASGDCFTVDGTSGTSLWFYDTNGRGQLTIADLSSARTYTLPDLSGTVALSAGNLGTGGALFANNGLIATSTNFLWNNASRYLQLGSSGNAGELRIYSSSGSGRYLGLAATSTMTQTTTYYFPPDYGTSDFVLTTDGNGNLTWQSVSGVGGVSGTGVAGRVTFWTDTSQISSSGNFLWDNTANLLTITGSSTITGNINLGGYLQRTGGNLTIRTLSSGEIILDSASGVVRLADGTVMLTSGGGPASRQTGEQILREMIPILGFDLPAQTATTSYVKISRTIQDYPFSTTTSGTTRVHKLAIRYTDNLPLASSTDWRVATTTGSAFYSFTLPGSNNSALDSGQATTTNVTIPQDGTDWWLEVKSQAPFDENKIKIFQIFLAAYDQIQ